MNLRYKVAPFFSQNVRNLSDLWQGNALSGEHGYKSLWLNALWNQHFWLVWATSLDKLSDESTIR